MRYCFGTDNEKCKDENNQAGVQVLSTQLYTAVNDNESGLTEHRENRAIEYGFLTEQNRRQCERLQIPELNSGFAPVYWFTGRDLTEIKADEQGYFVGSNEEGRLPLTFVTDVESEGNYKVDITLYAQKDVSEAVIFLGRRRLACLGKLSQGQEFKGSYMTNICPIIARNHAEPMQDLTLDVTVIGRNVHLKELIVTKVNCPTVYIAGDSTVTDQSADYPYYPYHSYAGWGQMLSYYMGDSAAVSNHSHSGLTTESFRSEGHYAILLDRIQKGDICLIQFAHNDQKLSHLLAEGGYRENLIRYIGEIQAKEAIPVIVTPLARNTWKGNEAVYNDLLEGYSDECKKIGREMGVYVLDLHEKSRDLVTSLGREAVKSYYFPSDYTHSNDYGAFLFAGYVFLEMQKVEELAAICRGSRTKEAIQALCKKEWIPPEDMPDILPPEDLADIKNPDEQQLFADLERPEETLTRVEALEFIITTMHFFPTNVYNDAFDDIIGHELYAGSVECAYQNGLIPDDMVDDHKFYPGKAITGSEFIEIASNGYKSRKGIAIPSELINGVVNEDKITRETAARICRQLHI